MPLVDRFEIANARRGLRSGRLVRPRRSVSLRSRFSGIETAIARRLSTEVRKTARLIAVDAAERIEPGPDPIHLSEAIHVERDAPAAYRVVAGDGDAFYGHILEHGSVKMAPRPFLIPAMDAQTDDAVRRARAALRGL